MATTLTFILTLTLTLTSMYHRLQQLILLKTSSDIMTAWLRMSSKHKIHKPAATTLSTNALNSNLATKSGSYRIISEPNAPPKSSIGNDSDLSKSCNGSVSKPIGWNYQQLCASTPSSMSLYWNRTSPPRFLSESGILPLLS